MPALVRLSNSRANSNNEKQQRRMHCNRTSPVLTGCVASVFRFSLPVFVLLSGRKFESGVADRHIPHCKNTKNKPKSNTASIARLGSTSTVAKRR